MTGGKSLTPRHFQGIVAQRQKRAQLARRIRHERRKQTRQSSHHFEQMMQHFADASLLFWIFDHRERRSLDDVAIRMIERRPDGLQGAMEL